MHLCSAYGLQEIWNECVEQAPCNNETKDNFIEYDDTDLGEILSKFILTVNDRKTAKFTEIVSQFLNGAYNHDKVRFPHTEFDPVPIKKIESGLIVGK